MVVIRKQQMDDMSPDEVRKFEDRMLEHLRECFPEECEDMSEDELREMIRHGVDKAESYGIDAEDDVCGYIDVMAVFGPDFDTDPECAWAAAILNDESIDPEDRSDALCDEADARIEAMEGQADEEV